MLPQSPPTANLQALADQLLLQKFSPAAVLVNGLGDILYISGHTGQYLEQMCIRDRSRGWAANPSGRRKNLRRNGGRFDGQCPQERP